MATIRNFGHYWSRNLIDWGYSGRSGSLLGALKPNADESDADFRNQIGIYVLYDENREAIYVGQAGGGHIINAADLIYLAILHAAMEPPTDLIGSEIPRLQTH